MSEQDPINEEPRYLLTRAATCSCGSPSLTHDSRFIYCPYCKAKVSKEEFFRGR